ncbi:MAG: tRNA lysidine(34) synthetase TilS [Chloroflexi bacterium]|nr:tRNA lysidine(34) synthetase TilS [Chloroflexota bacterium]
MTGKRDFETRLLAGLRTAGVGPGGPLIAAVSGGPDSMALLTGLLSLNSARPEAAPVVVAAHFNHRLRGPESEGDARYVSDFCSDHGIELVMGTGDVNEYRSERGLSMEVAARQLRYDFLAHAAIERNAQGVATGHTLDDQAETVLLHATRGSGLRGIAGMRWRTELARSSGTPLTVVRPLLGMRRTDTEAYCAESGIRPRRDSSNADVSMARNRIRHRVLPELEQINPDASGALARLAEIVTVDLEWLEQEAQEAWDRIATRAPDGSISFDRAGLAAADRAISSRLLMRAHQAVSNPGSTSGDELAAVHVDSTLALLAGRTGAEMSLPGGVRARLDYEALLIARSGTGDEADDCPYPIWTGSAKLRVPGSAQIGDTHDLVASEESPPAGSTVRDASVGYLDADATGRDFLVRSRRDGDRFQPLGMEGEKKIQDFFVDERVPREWRDRIPLVEAVGTGRGIAWVAGYRPAHWARVTPGTRTAIRLELLRRSPKTQSS